MSNKVQFKHQETTSNGIKKNLKISYKTLQRLSFCFCTFLQFFHQPSFHSYKYFCIADPDRDKDILLFCHFFLNTGFCNHISKGNCTKWEKLITDRELLTIISK